VGRVGWRRKIEGVRVGVRQEKKRGGDRWGKRKEGGGGE